MRVLPPLLMAIFLALVVLFQPVLAEEVLLRNGNKIDYGPTWEKNGMIYFYFHDYGIVGISKTAVVGKTGLLGELRGDHFVSEEYQCRISIPRGWHAANAVEAIDLMPMDQKRKKSFQSLNPQEAMQKMGFLVILYETRPWGTAGYNPRILVTVEDLSKYSGVDEPIDFLIKTTSSLNNRYSNFRQIKRPQAVVIDDTPSAKQKVSYDIVVNNKPVNITQWQYVFINRGKIYSLSALDGSKEFRSKEKRFITALESFRFLN